jgi:anti-sigma B factor antagonist
VILIASKTNRTQIRHFSLVSKTTIPTLSLALRLLHQPFAVSKKSRGGLVKELRSVVFANRKVGLLTATGGFTCEVEKAENDQYGNMVTTVKCYGKVTSETAWELRIAVKPLLALGGRIIINLSEVNYLDSSGVGALVGLKLSAMKQGYCILEFANVRPRIQELLRVSNLTQILSSSQSNFPPFYF